MTFQRILGAAAIAAVLLVVLAALGFGLIVRSIDVADHAAIRQAIMDAPSQERGAPELEPYVGAFREGFFPECVALSILVREVGWESPVDAAIRSDAILPPPGVSICDELPKSVMDQNSVGWFSYARYWHGALIVSRAVLSAYDYESLQHLAFALVWASLAALAGATAWRISPSGGLALGAILCALTDAASIGRLPVQAIGMASLFALAAVYVAWPARWRGAATLAAAAALGGVYNFFDFLCNPAVFAALCGWAWLASGAAMGERRPWWGGLLVFCAALGGYGGFWALKWAIATVYALNGGEVYLFTSNEFTRWNATALEGWTPGVALAAVIAASVDAAWKLAAVLVALGAALALWGRALKDARFWTLLIPLLPAALVLEAMARHTLLHATFTFRLVPVALALVVASLALVAGGTRGSGSDVNPGLEA